MSSMMDYGNKECPVCHKPIEPEQSIYGMFRSKALEIEADDIEAYEISDPENVIGVNWDYDDVVIVHYECLRFDHETS